jgi:hypothetical protein
MAGHPNNASLIRTLCGSNPRSAGFVRLAIISALLAFPTAVLMDSLAQIGALPRPVAMILAPGHLLTTLATPNPQVVGHFLSPSPHSSLAFLADLLYWFLIFFGLSCRLAGLRKSD